jgi:uncharacterized protein (TIGR00296 family)
LPLVALPSLICLPWSSRSQTLKRFPSVASRHVLPGLAIDVSVLGPALPIRAEDVTVGVHGLILRHAGHSGLLLPQVPAEQGWDKEAFLEATCRKAGLASGAWKEKGAQLLGFTAEVIEEDENREKGAKEAKP